MTKCKKLLTEYGLPALCTLITGCLVLALKGIWPFGNESIDYYDMAQQLAAEYIHIYDELHFDVSMFYDWYTNLGSSIPGGTYVVISNLLLYLFPRESILYAFSVLFLIKTAASSVSMSFLIGKEAPKCPLLFRVMLSVGYGLCGFILMNYTIIVWLDITIMIPLIVYFAKRALTQGKIMGLAISLSFILMITFTLPAMVLIYLFMITGLYIAVRKEGSPGRLCVCRLGEGIALGMLLSAWSWIPMLLGSAGGFRYELEASESLLSKYLKIVMHVKPDYATRWWALLGLSFAGTVCIIGLIGDIKKRNLRRFAFAFGTLVITFIQLLFENIQLFWHFGSYVNYPVRNGFLMYVAAACLAAVYLQEMFAKNPADNADKSYDIKQTDGRECLGTAKQRSYIVSAAAFIISCAFASVGIIWYKSNPGMSVYTVFRVTLLCMAACFLIYLFLILYKKGRYAKASAFLIAAELIFYGVLMIGKPSYITGYAEEAEQEGDYIRIAYWLKSELGIEESSLNRIKNPDESLNANYGRFLKRASVSGWSPSFASSEAIADHFKKGYSVQYTRVLDAGGDVLTDALYHVTEVLSCLPQSDKLYKKGKSASAVVDHITGQEREYSLYECRYVLPFGNVIPSYELLEDIAKSGRDDYDNALVRAIGAEDESLSDAVIREVLYEGEPSAVLDFDIKGNKALYLTGNTADSEAKDLRISVNGEAAAVPSLKETDNTLYPAHFNNANVLLGCFSDEKVTIELEKVESEGSFDYDIEVFTIDLDVLYSLCAYAADGEGSFSAGKSCFRASVAAPCGSYLLLPIAYDEGWEANVNGKKAETVKVDAFLTAVPLEAGDNDVVMTYFPKIMKPWCVLSLLTLAFIITLHGVLLYGKSRKNPAKSRNTVRSLISAETKEKVLAAEVKADRLLGAIYIAVWALMVIVFIIIPAGYGIIFYLGLG